MTSEILNDLAVTCDVLPEISDHNMILVGASLLNTPTHANLETVKTKYNFKKSDFKQINEKFQNLSNYFLNNKNLATTIKWENFKCTIEQSLHQHVPKLLPRAKGKPWMTRSLLRLIRVRNRVFNRCNKYPTTENITLEAKLKQQAKCEI